MRGNTERGDKGGGRHDMRHVKKAPHPPTHLRDHDRQKITVFVYVDSTGLLNSRSKVGIRRKPQTPIKKKVAKRQSRHPTKAATTIRLGRSPIDHLRWKWPENQALTCPYLRHILTKCRRSLSPTLARHGMASKSKQQQKEQEEAGLKSDSNTGSKKSTNYALPSWHVGTFESTYAGFFFSKHTE